MLIVLWSRSTIMKSNDPWLCSGNFFKNFSLFYPRQKDVRGAGREGGKEHQRWSFLLPLPPWLLPCGSWEICVRPEADVTIVLLFLCFQPLVLVVLTWVVGCKDVGCGEPFVATHAPGRRSVCSMSVRYYGGRQCSEWTKMVPCFLHFQTTSPWGKLYHLALLICEMGE